MKRGKGIVDDKADNKSVKPFLVLFVFLLRGVRIGEADVGGGEVRNVCALFGRIYI